MGSKFATGLTDRCSPSGRRTVEPSAAEPLFFDDPFAFPDHHHLVGSDIIVGFFQTERPENFQADGGDFAETEMQPVVVDRIKTGLRQHRLRLLPFSVIADHFRADGAAVGLDADQLHFHPMVAAGNVIPQQRGRFVHIHYEDVDIPIVVEVSESTAAAGVLGADAGSSLLDQLFEFAVAQVAVDYSRRLVLVARNHGFQFRVNVAGHQEQVGQSVVVQVDDAVTPAHETLTGQRRMDAIAILDYFAPLKKWLDEQNKGKPIGW